MGCKGKHAPQEITGALSRAGAPAFIGEERNYMSSGSFSPQPRPLLRGVLLLIVSARGKGGAGSVRVSRTRDACGRQLAFCIHVAEAFQALRCSLFVLLFPCNPATPPHRGRRGEKAGEAPERDRRGCLCCQ